MQAQAMLSIARAKRPDEILEEMEHESIWLKELLLGAKESDASDIHIRPDLDENTWDIYLKAHLEVDGEKKLFDVVQDEIIAQAIISRIKVLGKFDLSTDEISQDRGFSLKLTRCRYRANLLPTEFGEAFVFRTIKSDDMPRISSLNLSEQLQEHYKLALKNRRGLILFTGNTGSGKSTTVEAGLLEIDRAKKEVLAIQDPVERIIKDVKHVPITRHLPWSTAIRAAMRAAPKVIYIGEIRDADSALQALAASNTGHLVISTIHVSRVSGIFDRLAEWGIDRRLIADNLLFATNQTLIKKLCPHCKIPNKSGGFDKGPGCNKCNDGQKGRVPIVEYIYAPAYEKMAFFDKQDFESTQIRQTFAKDASRLADQGLISTKEAKKWQNHQ